MRFQILSLSGGGYLGLYTAAVLRKLEAEFSGPIASHFDLIAGTSIGGIIALGLAADIPAAKIAADFEEDGTNIFSERRAARTWLGNVWDVRRSLFSAKYGDAALRNTVERVLGPNLTIGDLSHPVIIPTVNLTKGSPQMFKTPHHSDFKRDYRLKAADVAMATSAAPTYFPIAQIEDELFVDGGLFANAPDLIALHEAEHFFQIPAADVHVLSIGTTTTQISLSHTTNRKLGIFGWGRRLATAIISAQQMDVGYMMAHKLGDRYVRIDTVQSKEQERDLDLDIATPDAQKTIRGLASGAFQENINNPKLQEIFSYSAPPPSFHRTGGKEIV